MSESISVSELNCYTKQLIERDEVLSQIWVEGEISGLTIHRQTGHVYFTLKDSAASVRAVMFSTYASELRFVPKDGMFVVTRCKVSFYEKSGSFQLTVFDLLPKGVGAAQKQLEQSRQKLAEDGLLAPERKRQLPAAPKIIGVITSASGAAIQDILSIAESRDPTVQIRIYDCAVQGIYAVKDIGNACRMICARPEVDAVIIARGGGSKEDLWYFNDEALVRAAAALPVPWVSAVGHEIDITLLDAVSDARAETPSAAAAMVTRDLKSLCRNTQSALDIAGDRLLLKISLMQESIEEEKTILLQDTLSRLEMRRAAVTQLADRCRTLDPMNVLMRGYAHVTKGADDVQSIRQLRENDAIQVNLRDGQAHCVVERVQEVEQR